jgi:hypothetical protein
MPFDSSEIQNRAALVETVSAIVKVFDKSAKAADKAADNKVAACDDILSTFRVALNDYDVPPFYFWMDICEANGYAYSRLDPATGKTTKVEGDKPHNTLKNVATQIKKYFENNGNLEIATYTELRKANAPAPKSDWDKAMSALAKLSAEELEQVRKGLNEAAEA